MTPSREFLNLYISGKLTKESFKKLSDSVVITDSFLDEFLNCELHKGKSENYVLNTLADKIAANINTYHETLFSFFREQEDLNKFHKMILRKIDKNNISSTVKLGLVNYVY